MISTQPTKIEAKVQVRKIFEYLAEYSRLKNPLKHSVSDYPWHFSLASLPQHSSIEVYEEPGEGQRRLLRVGRASLTPCPPPPEPLSAWLNPDWDRFEVRESSLIDLPADLESYPQEIQELLATWLPLRQRWRIEEAPARKAYQIFERMFELKGNLDREGERYALTLGQGLLRWKTLEGTVVDHPVLWQRCCLVFEPEIPQFTVEYADEGLQFPTGLIRQLAEADPSGLPNLLDTIRTAPFDILSPESADFLRGMARRLWSQGEYYDEIGGPLPTDRPSIRPDPVLVLVPRDRGQAEAAEHFLEALDDFELPSSLLNLIGVDVSPDQVARQRSQEMPLLFTKPSNAEQERVARRLESNGCVLVQGPPGTGKTHTIGNLIGHLLAQGKSILVTSHTSKALSVIRHQVVAQLQPLCVAVLDEGSDSKKHLESAVKTIADKLTQVTGDELERQAQELKERRAQLVQQVADTQEKLLAAHRSEYEDLLIGGQAISPLEAARSLRQGQGQHDWIPGSVKLGQVCSLTAEEVHELYHLQHSLSAEEEQMLAEGLPSSSALIDAATFTGLTQIEESLRQEGTTFGAQYWTQNSASLEQLQQARQAAEKILAQLSWEETWLAECLAAGSQPGEAMLWRELLALIESTAEACTQRRSLVYQSNPQLGELNWPLPRQIEVCQDLLNYLRSGKKLNFLGTFFKPEWKEFRKRTQVQGREPSKESDFEALLAQLQLREAREQLQARWSRQMEGLGAPALPTESPEREAVHLALRLRQTLEWEETSWKPFEQQLLGLGLDWNAILAQAAPQSGSLAQLKCRQQAMSQVLLRTLNERSNGLYLAQLDRQLAESFSALSQSGSRLARELERAAQERNSSAYRRGWEQLRELEAKAPAAQRRQQLLERLRVTAPGWAQALAERSSDHRGPSPAGPLQPAWQWAQWSQQLELRHQLDLNQLQARVSQLQEQLRQLTAHYVEVLTWKYQAQRTGNAQRQALNGWLESMKRIGKGTSKHVEFYRAQAREKLKECRSAVPVWIMPLSQVVESYRPGQTVFDVVILDEASQADVTGLLALTMGREAIVVGDDEQVSPTTFERTEKALALAQERLSGIPNWELYGGKRSLYDMAKTSFGETIRLREHFRCVPEIIAFSNELCYNGDILPLRESEKVLLPAVIAHRVGEGKRQGKAKTNVGEAQEITALIGACIEQEEYAGKTFGVISLVGDDQALLVQQFLTQRLHPSVLQARRIVCGNASQFQGDERDVMFLSFVNSPNEGPGPLRLVEAKNEDRQRYNVAASRARDQMWLVHSLNPANDLKPQDLRARLLKKAEQATPEDEIQRLRPSTESVFEEQVLERLLKAGYRVIPQLAIGSYRIDLVVVGHSRRIAIECDGEAYHGPSRVAEDLARQQILERVAKLTFIRIRGSHYFRDPEEAMQRVFESLQALGVEKLGSEPQANVAPPGRLRETIARRAQVLAQEWFGQGTLVENSLWGELFQLLQNWPNLKARPYEEAEEAWALSVLYGGEEILVVDQASPGFSALQQQAERSFLKTVAVDRLDPDETLRRILTEFNLDQREDSRENLRAIREPLPPRDLGGAVTLAPQAAPGAAIPTAQAVVALLMRVVKADGVTLSEELVGVADFFARRFGYHDCTPEQVQKWIDDDSKLEAPAPEMASALRKLTREQRELVLQGGVELAWCDGELHPQEKRTLFSLGIELDLDRTTVEALLAQHSRDGFDPLQVLGLPPLALPQEIIQAVQKLRQRFDPQHFIEQGAEFQALAAARRADIEKAWDRLQQEHDLESHLTHAQGGALHLPREPLRLPLGPPAISDQGGAVRLPLGPPAILGGCPPNQSALDYRSFDGEAGPDPRQAPLEQVMQGLYRIARIEAPLTIGRLYEVYLRGCGIKRLGGELRQTLSRALKVAVDQGLLAWAEGEDPAKLHTVVALSQGPKVLVRQRGPRSLEEIPDSELRALAERLRVDHVWESEEHLRAILGHYESKKLTNNTKERLLNALAGRPRRESSGEDLAQAQTKETD